MTQAVTPAVPMQLTGLLYSAVLTSSTGDTTDTAIPHGLANAPSKYWATPIGEVVAANVVITSVDSTNINVRVTSGHGAIIFWQL